MKILIAADIFPPQSGGPATYSVSLANELTKQGDEVKIVSLNPDSDKSVLNNKVELYTVSGKCKLLKYFKYLRLLCQHAKDVGVIYAMGPVNAGLPALIVAKRRKKKLVVKVVGDYAWEQGIQRFGVKELMDDFQKKENYAWQVKILRWIEKFVTRKSNIVVVPSNYLRNIVLGWGVKNENIRVVYNSIGSIHLYPTEKTSNEKRIISAGRLVPWKGMKELIEIMPDIIKEFPDARLKIFGDGPEMKNLQTKVVELKMEKFVELPGNLAHEELLRQINAADVFVLNSGYEGLSHVLLEAVYCGIPVLTSRIGGNPEVVFSGKNGDLFEWNNKEEMKEKVLQILASKGFTRDIKKQAEFIRQFSLDNMIKHTREILQALCKP